MMSQGQITSFPLQMVSSAKFGQYPKISVENAYNMIESDGWMVPYAGYKNVADISPNGKGRGIFNSTRANKLFAVINNSLYAINPDISYVKVAELATFEGDIYMDENQKHEIGICDLKNIYIYNYFSGSFGIATTSNGPLDFTPGYIAYQDGRFLSVDLNSQTWRLSSEENSLDWPNDSSHVGTFQTKADSPKAIFRIPGKGNLLFVMGSTLTEPWYDTGQQLFPYLRSTSFNVDYGTLSAATIAFSDNYIAWLAANEKSGPVIMFSDGGEIQSVSTDGIDFKLEKLKNPSNSYGFFFKQFGHLFYQFTFVEDNLSYAYDFKNKKFYTLCDENMNHHIAKRIAFFNNSYYFISTNDGNLYELNSKYTNYNYGLDASGKPLLKEIPRIIIPPTIRAPNGATFITNSLTFILEMGADDFYNTPLPSQVGAVGYPYPVRKPRVDLSLSTDGGVSFGNSYGIECNAYGARRNKIQFWNLGWSNEMTLQFRFWGMGRFLFTNGTVDIMA